MVLRALLSAAFLFCMATVCAFAAMTPTDALDQARQAFFFVHRKDWDSARAQAKASNVPAVVKLAQWQYFLDQDSQAPFDDIIRFIEENPNWPDAKKLRARAELALRSGNVPDHGIIAWFDRNPPVTGVGKIALAEALRRNKLADQEKISGLIHEAWRGGDFDETQQALILDTYGDLLTQKDDIARIDRLLWEEKIASARRILDRVPKDYQRLFQARMDLLKDKKTAGLAIARVPSALRKDPGLLYDRMRYRARRDDDKGVREILLNAPANPPYPDKWWKTREYQAREAIGEKNYVVAKKLLAGRKALEGSDAADALWLEGWLHAEFLHEPKRAYENFSRMYDNVHTPVSRARAAYWAGRAAEQSGDQESAKAWYKNAAAYPTTFYGQLGALKADGAAVLQVPASPGASEEETQAFDHGELAQAASVCLTLGEKDWARHIISHMIETAATDKEAALAAGLGARLGDTYLGVHGAKKALQRNVVLINAGYPRPETPNAPVERALTLAITRQESEFDPQAQSPSGALGLMQLLPKTAREIARKNTMDFSRNQLFDPAYNMTLGSLYLARLLNSYDGSYVMAIAAYNAGVGNVRNWTSQFGTPNNNAESAIDWIEKIPFSETRNYVERVLENVQVYRHLETGESPLHLAEDLAR